MIGSEPPNGSAPTMRVDALVVQRPSVLLVDDEQHVLDAIAANLRKEFELTARTRAAEALVLLGQRPFDAVVSDLRMPEMDGVQFLEEVKRIAPSTARVLLTGHADVGSAIAAVNAAAVSRFLLKPCPSATLARTLLEVIQSSRPVNASALSRLGRQATLGVMAGSIGHEIGNLVTALGGSLESVRESVEHGQVPPLEEVRLLDLVGLRLLAHAKHLRDLSRPRELDVREVDATVVAAVAMHLVEKTGLLRAAPAVLVAPPTPVMVRADASSVEGVLVDLLKNAADAIRARIGQETDAGIIGEPGRIAVSIARQSEGYVSVVVEDNGTGLDQEQLDRLFETFRSTKGEAGTGLGLSVAHAILERQGARLRAESRPGEGASFIVELPSA